jgi:hypothetical protein
VTGEFLHPAFLGYSGKNKFLHIYLMHKILNLTSNNNNKHDRQLPPATRWMYTVPQHNQRDNRQPQHAEKSYRKLRRTHSSFAKTISIIITK